MITRYLAKAISAKIEHHAKTTEPHDEAQRKVVKTAMYLGAVVALGELQKINSEVEQVIENLAKEIGV